MNKENKIFDTSNMDQSPYNDSNKICHPKEDLILGVYAKQSLKRRYGGKTEAEKKAFDLQWLCWIIDRHLDYYGGKSFKENCKNDYAGCYFVRKQIDSFEPYPSIMLISLETLKERPVWKGLGTDIYNVLCSYKQDDPDEYPIISNGLDILFQVELIDTEGKTFEPFSVFSNPALSPSRCTLFRQHLYPLQRTETNELEDGEFYFILQQIINLEKELYKNQITLRSISNKKITKKLAVEKYFNILLDRCKSNIFKPRNQNDWINEIYYMGLEENIWGSSQEKSAQLTIKKYLSKLKYTERAEPFNSRY